MFKIGQSKTALLIRIKNIVEQKNQHRKVVILYGKYFPLAGVGAKSTVMFLSKINIVLLFQELKNPLP